MLLKFDSFDHPGAANLAKSINLVTLKILQSNLKFVLTIPHLAKHEIWQNQAIW